MYCAYQFYIVDLLYFHHALLSLEMEASIPTGKEPPWGLKGKN
jgi:hypothetical protein